MNGTIWFEVPAASMLLITAAVMLARCVPRFEAAT